MNHAGMAAHDGYVEHSHEVRADHKGVGIIPGHWHAVSRAAVADLELITEAALRGDDSPVPAGTICEASDRLRILIEMLPSLD